MKKLTLLLGFGCFCVLLNAQSRWSFGLQLAGGLNGKADLQENYYNDSALGTSYGSNEEFRSPNMAFGWWTEFAISKRWSVRTGGEYQLINQHSRTISTYHLASGAQDFYSRNNNQLQEEWINIPLTFQYYFNDGRNATWRPFVQLGVRGGFLNKQSNIADQIWTDAAGDTYPSAYEHENELDSEWYPFKRWNMSAQIGAGIQLGRSELSIVYLGNFRRPSQQVDYYLWNNAYFCDVGDCYYPYFENNQRHRMPGSLRLNFQYRIF